MIFKDNYEESIKKAKAQDNKKLEAICQKLEDDIATATSNAKFLNSVNNHIEKAQVERALPARVRWVLQAAKKLGRAS